MTIYERIKNRRIALGMSQTELAKKVGYVGKSAISKVENGERDISQSMIEQYAKALNVSPIYLLYGDDYDGDQWPSDCESLNRRFANIFPIEKKKIPLLGDIACGKPIFANEEHESYVLAGTDIKADFCLRAHGDSMTGARIFDGDIVFIQKADIVNNGEIAAVIIEDEATLKRIYYYPNNGKLVLNAENPKYEPLVYVGEELNQIHILGKAIAFQSDIR